MNAAALVARIRDHYVDQFRAFTKKQRANCTQGAPEVKLRLSEQSKLLDRLYCVDFLKNDGSSTIVELQPESILTFGEINGTFGKASLSIESLRWDDVLIRHDLDELPPNEIADWFQLWFDPEEKRHDPDADVSKSVHSVLVQPNSLSIDFGTAESEAFWDILQLLESAGAKQIQISSSGPGASNSG